MALINIPNILTALNLLSGILSIMLSLSGRIDLAIYPVFGSLIFDYLDGFAARLLKQQSEIGKQLDSLADVVSFGVVPGVWMMVLFPSILVGAFSGNVVEVQLNFSIWLNSCMSGHSMNLFPLLALLIPVFSMFRLAKFNLDTRQSTSFIGLPTPANTLFFMIFPIVFFATDAADTTILFRQFFLQPMVVVICIMLFSYLLIAELPLFSLKFKSFSVADNKVRYAFLVVVLLTILLWKFLAIPIIIVLYLVFSIIELKFAKKEKP